MQEPILTPQYPPVHYYYYLRHAVVVAMPSERGRTNKTAANERGTRKWMAARTRLKTLQRWGTLWMGNRGRYDTLKQNLVVSIGCRILVGEGQGSQGNQEFGLETQDPVTTAHLNT